MVKKKGLPQQGELVICKISKINPHSVFVYMEEYDREGMVHISEISSGWVKDIRQYVKQGQTRVGKVVRIDGDHISLSLKRVDKKQENNKTKEYRLNQRAEKMLELVAKQLGKTLEQAYEEVGFKLQDTFGSLYDGFKISIQTPEVLVENDIPKAWVDQIRAIAEKSITQKEFEFRARLHVKTYKPAGVNIIKKLLAAAEGSGLKIQYIAAPDYMVRYSSMNAKKGEKEFLEKLENIKSGDAEISFEMVE